VCRFEVWYTLYMIHKKVRMVNGYRLIYLPAHPRAMKSGSHTGWVYEHIVVATDSIGRQLRDNEVVHHLDFDRSNNKSTNLLILERGQHAKLHAWLKSIPSSWQQLVKSQVDSEGNKIAYSKFCPVCNSTVQDKRGTYCSVKCYRQASRKVDRPDRDQLAKDIVNLNWLAIGRKYGVSDNAVRKWARSYGLLSQS